MRINILCDNLVNKANFLAEHGFCVFLSMPSLKILFDTGQSDIFFKNSLHSGINAVIELKKNIKTLKYTQVSEKVIF